MIIDYHENRRKGKVGLRYRAKMSKHPVRVIENNIPILYFMDGYQFAQVVGMSCPTDDPVPYFFQEGAKTTLRASDFKIIRDVLDLCIRDDAPVIVKKYSFEYYVAMTPKVFEKYRPLFETDSLKKED